MNPQSPSTAGPSSSQISPSTELRRTAGRRPLLDDDKRRQIIAILDLLPPDWQAKVIQKLDDLGAHFSTPALSDDANLHSKPRAQVQDPPRLAASPLAEVNLNTTQAC